jgi:hypothetical protein
MTSSHAPDSAPADRGSEAADAEPPGAAARAGRLRLPSRSGQDAIPGVSSGRVRTAYRLGENCERAGDHEGAIIWFRRAAEAGHPEAAMRLCGLLGRIIDAHLDSSRDDGQARRIDLTLMTEAIRWLSCARGRSEPQMIELILETLRRQQCLAAAHLPGEASPRPGPRR